MTKQVIVVLLFATLMLAFSSCKKCYTCTFSEDNVQELCSKDFPDGTDGLMMTVQAFDEQGYTCTEK